MTIAGRPLPVALAAAGFALAALYSLLLAAITTAALLLIAGFAAALFAVAAIAWVYMLLRTAWRLWRLDPRGLGLARIMAWLLVAAAAFGVVWPTRSAGGFVALALALAIAGYLHLPATAREFEPLQWQPEDV